MKGCEHTDRLLLSVAHQCTAQFEKYPVAGGESEDKALLVGKGCRFFFGGSQVQQPGGKRERSVLFVTPCVVLEKLLGGSAQPGIRSLDLKECLRCGIQEADLACPVPHQDGIGKGRNICFELLE